MTAAQALARIQAALATEGQHTGGATGEITRIVQEAIDAAKAERKQPVEAAQERIKTLRDFARTKCTRFWLWHGKEWHEAVWNNRSILFNGRAGPAFELYDCPAIPIIPPKPLE